MCAQTTEIALSSPLVVVNPRTKVMYRNWNCHEHLPFRNYLRVDYCNARSCKSPFSNDGKWCINLREYLHNKLGLNEPIQRESFHIFSWPFVTALQKEIIVSSLPPCNGIVSIYIFWMLSEEGKRMQLCKWSVIASKLTRRRSIKLYFSAQVAFLLERAKSAGSYRFICSKAQKGQVAKK